MKSLIGGRALWVGLLVMALTLPSVAFADTLELKDRRVIKGKYVGGTQANVRFQVDGKVEQYPVEEVLVVTFEGDTGTAEERGGASRPSGESESRTPPASERVTVPAGTSLLVRMIDSVDSETNKVGDRFRASLEENLTVDDTVVAPRGTDVYGRLVEVKGAGRVAGKSQLKLELTDILIDQQRQPIMSGDYEVAGKSRGGDSAKKVAGGAAIGAIIGAIAGGGKGAAIGAGVGAGAGTAIQVLTKGEQVRVPSETLLEFRIEQPFTVVPARSDPR